MKTADVKKLGVWERAAYFVREREAVRLKKEAGLPKPWSDDERLLDYKFTCPVRIDDSVSRWLRNNWYGPHRDHPNTPIACMLARMFNVAGAGSVLHRLTDLVYPPTWPPGSKTAIDWKAVGRTVAKCWELGSVFNSAYIISGAKGEDKVTTVLRRVRAAAKEWPARVDPGSMANTHAALVEYEGFGSFLAGQVVADLRWAISGEWTDRFDWALPGPGSRRGIERLLSDSYARDVPTHDWFEEFQKYMTRMGAELPPELAGRMEAIDYQNTLCDHVDKAERLLLGEGRTKCRYDGRGTSTLPGLLD